MANPRVRTTLDLSPDARETLEHLKSTEERPMREVVEEALEDRRNQIEGGGDE